MPKRVFLLTKCIVEAKSGGISKPMFGGCPTLYDLLSKTPLVKGHFLKNYLSKAICHQKFAHICPTKHLEKLGQNFTNFWCMPPLSISAAVAKPFECKIIFLLKSKYI